MPDVQSTNSVADANRFAKLAAGLLSLVCVEAQTLARQRDVDSIRFLTREGIFFQKFFDVFARAANWPQRSALLHVSRMSTFAASLSHDGNVGLNRFFSQYQQAGWEQLLASLNAEWPVQGLPASAAVLEVAERRGSDLAKLIESTPAITNWINEIAAARKSDLLAYIAVSHADLLGSRDAVIVDIGWRGTIQDNLALLLPSICWHGVYFGLFPFLNPQPGNCSKRGILFEDGIDERGPIPANVFPVEYLFHAREGGILGYQDGKPIHEQFHQNDGEDFAACLQTALLDLAPARGKALADARTPPQREALLTNWRVEAAAFWRLSQSMTPALFEAISRFRHDETFGLAQTIEIVEAVSLRSMFRSLYNPRARSLFIQHSLAIPPQLRQSAALGWWLRCWFLLHRVVRRLKGISQSKE